MSEYDLLERILDKLTKPAIPLEAQLWDLSEVAAYLHRHTEVARSTIACLPSFPKAIRLPSKGKSHALYNAAEVVKWAHTHKEKA